MREGGLKARSARVYKRLGGLHKYFLRIPNRRVQAGKPTEINQQWAGDITYLQQGGQRRYLAAIMDLYSRKIVGWSYGKKKDSRLTIAALMFALRNRKPPAGLLFHTDRGTEYLCYEYQKVNDRNGIIPSMNRPRRCTDNAEMESFFHTMKSDIIKGNSFTAEVELRKSVWSYIHHFYNRARLHSSLRYLSPVEFEMRSA